MGQRPGGFDLARLSTATKIILGAGILYLIFLFLPWQRVCVGPFCGSSSGVSGVGIINLLLVIALIAMEVLIVANVQVTVGTQQQRYMVEAGIAGALLLFTIIKVLVDLNHIYFWAFIDLILAAIIAYGGYMRWQEAKMAAPPAGPPPPPPTTGGGFTT